ncbi:hypothetical protein GGI43DRAFT_104310 [Trichoderma evansii]
MKYEALGFVFVYIVFPLLDNMSHLHVLDLNWLNEFAFCFLEAFARAVGDLLAVTLDFGYTCMRPDGYWYDYIMIVMNICVYRSADEMQRIVFC